MQHTDLHPGNILVRVRPTGKAAGDGAAETTTLDDILMKPIRRGQAKAQLQLVRTKPPHHAFCLRATILHCRFVFFFSESIPLNIISLQHMLLSTTQGFGCLQGLA